MAISIARFTPPSTRQTTPSIDKSASYRNIRHCRILLFAAQGNYAHLTNATFLLNSTTPSAPSIPNPIVSPVNPQLPGAAGVTANEQTVIDPNDTYTATASVYKQFNRAYAVFGGTTSSTTYETTPSSNFNLAAYFGSGGIWFSPFFYAFANGAQSFYSPAVGIGSTSSYAKAGIGSDRIGFFQGSIYAGEQMTTVADNGGQAGGDLYGGAISYFPIEPWSMTFSVDKLRNISNITVATSQALAGSAGALPSGAAAAWRFQEWQYRPTRRHNLRRSHIGQITYFRRKRRLLA